MQFNNSSHDISDEHILNLLHKSRKTRGKSPRYLIMRLPESAPFSSIPHLCEKLDVELLKIVISRHTCSVNEIVLAVAPLLETWGIHRPFNLINGRIWTLRNRRLIVQTGGGTIEPRYTMNPHLRGEGDAE